MCSHREWKSSAQPDDLGRRLRGLAGRAVFAGGAGEEGNGIVQWEDIERHDLGLVQADQSPALVTTTRHPSVPGGNGAW